MKPYNQVLISPVIIQDKIIICKKRAFFISHNEKSLVGGIRCYVSLVVEWGFVLTLQ